jgi:hypothetical protein
MAGFSAQGGTFTYTASGPPGRGTGTLQAKITGIAVETPSAEVVDMTGLYDETGHSIRVPTGDIRGGAVTIDYLHVGASAVEPQTLVGTYGQLRFLSANYSVTRQAVLESASHGARVGELVRGSVKFLLTDYYG